jgi:hypothetical protein
VTSLLQLDRLKRHDGVLALLVAVVALAAGTTRRDDLAWRYLHDAPPPPPSGLAPAPPPLPSPPRRVRVITKLEPPAQLADAPGGVDRSSVQLKPGAVVDLVEPSAIVGASAPRVDGWREIRTQAGRLGWVPEDSLHTEAASRTAVTLFDEYAALPGQEVTATHAGPLHASATLHDRIGGFARGEKLRVLRTEGQVLLASASDGADGQVIGYARITTVRGQPRPAPKPAAAPTRMPDIGPGSAATAGDEPRSANRAEPALKDARDHYAGGNFNDAEIKGEEAAALGSEEGRLLAAMAACKQGNPDKARRLSKQLRGPRLAQLRAACPDAAAPAAAPDPAAADPPTAGDGP